MSKNSNLNRARKAKNDEYFTTSTSIEEELKHYKNHFKNKIILCNANDDEDSEFWKYFKALFIHLKLKKLIAISYGNDANAFEFDGNKVVTNKLEGNGSFDSSEVIQYLNEADVVVTNPPFSLLKFFLPQLMEFNKKFLIIGPLHSISVKYMFKYITAGKVWLGNTRPKEFLKMDRITTESFGNAHWFTNLDYKRRHQDLTLYKEYNNEFYPKYDDYDAIEVDKVKNIPKDYFEKMGVPLSFISGWNPDQFKIIDVLSPCIKIKNPNSGLKKPILKKKFKRLIIKRR